MPHGIKNIYMAHYGQEHYAVIRDMSWTDNDDGCGGEIMEIEEHSDHDTVAQAAVAVAHAAVSVAQAVGSVNQTGPSSLMNLNTLTLMNSRQWVLTTEELRNVRIAAEQPVEHLLCTHHNIYLTTKSLLTLKDEEWLDDEVINSMMSNLKQYDVSMCNTYPQRRSSHCFSSFFMDALLDRDPVTKLDKEYTYSNVRKWSKKFDIFDKSKIFFPVNIRNKHWVLVVAYMKESRIVYLDSCGGKGNNVYTTAVKRYIAQDTLTKYKIVVDTRTWIVDDFYSMRMKWGLHMQTNDFDCGMFVIMYVDYILDNLNPNFTEMDLIECRMRVAVTILTGSIKYYV